MQQYDSFEVVGKFTPTYFQYDKEWTNPQGKKFVFNTMFVSVEKKGINPGNYPVSISEEQAEIFKKDETKFIGKEFEMVLELRWTRTQFGSYDKAKPILLRLGR